MRNKWYLCRRMKLVFATNNAHKLEEVREIFSGKVEVLSLKDIACTAEIPETSPTIEGNSLLKARYIYEHYGLDCFSDDTGLEVDALGGSPGVFSARYAGEPSNPAQNRAKLLKELGDCTDREARFRTVVTLIVGGEIHQFEGIVNGSISHQECGEQGFGYDSIFIPQGYTQTFAQIETIEKNHISHRSKALAALWEYLNQHCL